MHATCRASAMVERCAWIWRPTPDAMGEIIGGLKDLTALVRAAQHFGPLASVYTDDRIRRISVPLDRADGLIDPLLATSETLVHGDYWFRNVMASADDRYVVLDWQGCRVFSGIWELVYFVDLLRVLGPGSYRPLPVQEADLTAWYLTALRKHGHIISVADFHDVYLRSQVIQPLAHWLLNNALTIATGGAATVGQETEPSFRKSSHVGTWASTVLDL